MPVITQAKNEFLKFLISENILDQTKVIALETRANKENLLAEELLVRDKLINEEDLAKKKAKFFGLPYVDLTGQKIDPQILKLIPKAVAKHYHMIAYGRDDIELHVALLDPRDFQAMAAMDVLASEANLRLRYALTYQSSFEDAFKKYDVLKHEIEEVIDIAKSELTPEQQTKSALPVEEVIKGAPVSRIVSVIMRHAYDGHASDIHIEPYHGESRVRYRIDGTLKISLALPAELHSAIIARIKVLANLKLDETRIPQDGRITETINGQSVDFRVSTLPLQEGQEKAVLRILSAESAPTLEDLGFQPQHIKIIEEDIKKPHGLVLISGPTGAGKSTTLYAVLTLLNKEGVNIITLEDPIEYFISGVNQSQIRPEVHYNFATGLRAILRQDPNVIMVGEIRDAETSELAIHAALTGHLLLTTIHTNDALGVIPRLIDLKAEPFLLAATFNLAIAQRLARKICSNCKVPADLPDNIAKQILQELKQTPVNFLPAEYDLNKPLIFYRGRGCSKCGITGYKGRIAVAEVIRRTSNLERLIALGFPHQEVEQELKAQGMITLRQDALLKALKGLTTVEEVLRISQE